MRRACLASMTTLLLMLSAAAAGGQEIERELGTDLADYGGFVGLDVRYGQLLEDYSLIMGGHIALMVGHRFYAGIIGNALISNPRLVDAVVLPAPTLDMHYGGALLGWVVPFQSPVQIALEAVVGGGRARGAAPVGTSQEDSDWDGILVVEPGLILDVQFAEMLRLGLGVSYRYVGSADIPNVSDDHLRGITGTASFRLTWF